MPPLVLLLGYAVVINLSGFVAMALDKRRAAEGLWRIPERTLLALAAVGGSPGVVTAQYRLRHKTWKQPFRTYLHLIVGAQVVLLAGFLWLWVRAIFQ